ncbi:AMP-binding protein [Edaphocola aurantiacus]|uniref:AMP-binding protein n=1 Tax=Edaphocola aurantiacus TaxID=2601682 RepID=UPI001C97892F|nr:AMP-binding protein [Edaphocola aurantiacus]
MNADQLYRDSIADKELFWQQQAGQLDWYTFPEIILGSDETGYPQWFPDGMLNMCYLAVDRHVAEGYGAQVAVIYDSPVTGQQQKYTYAQVQHEVAKLAGGLRGLGLKEGDTAIIYMPMIPQSMFAMLACARIGVIHSVVFGGFAPHELSVRIDDCKPKVILTASVGIEGKKTIPYMPMVTEAIALSAHKPEHIVHVDRKLADIKPAKGVIDYAALVAAFAPVPCVPLPSTHPLYVLYTSGTTGKPKGIIRDTGGYATALQFSMTHIYGAQPGEVFWAASDVGWVVGHSYIVYGPLLNRNTTVVFEGKPIMTPDAGTFWRIISEHQVKIMFTAPTAIRAIKKEDPEGLLVKQYNLSCLRTQFLAGERCDVATLDWYEQHVGVPAIDHFWQTESGWPVLGLQRGVEQEPIIRAAAGKPIPGYDIRVFNDNGYELDAHHEGYLVIKLPLPPGTLTGLWNDPERFKRGYLEQFPGYYFSGDGVIRNEDGYMFITGRVDDVINVAGHRMSTAEMEEVVAGQPEVAECAVVGIEDTLKGQVPMALVVLKQGVADPGQVPAAVVQLVREKIGAVACLKEVLVVQRLPKTRSGKILRKLIRTMIDGKAYQVPSTIDDPAIIEELQEQFALIKK